MRLLDRYALRRLAGPLWWCLALFLLLYLVIDLFGHLEEFLRLQVPPAVIARYYGAMLPIIFVQVAPFAVLMAVLYTVGNLNRHQELIAMRASGISPWAIVRPLLLAGALVSGLVLCANEGLMPQATATVHALWDQYLDRPAELAKPESQRIPRSLAVFGNSGHTLIYARKFDVDAKTLEDVIILEHGQDLGLRRKIVAKSAVWTPEGWRFSHCTVLRFNSQGRLFGKAVTYERKMIPLAQSPDGLVRAERQTQAMSYHELAKYIKRAGGRGSEATRKLRVDLQTKLAFPFASLVVVLFGAPLAVNATRGGTLLGMGMAVGAAVAFYGTQAIFVAIGKGGWLPPATAAWAANLLFGGVGLHLLRRRLG
ncbi:MAG: hypothetical protein A3C53_00785 [Omnitrophica WOR_2 bacterium RIFCSPHIGHO2_02_FULL_68_15]|nr:MAG: hypothetical protein A3C53_00785 [Omnitrophica WOR_2 bacterium RIFCSPHIGHO2_02_FULL_68_15]